MAAQWTAAEVNQAVGIALKGGSVVEAIESENWVLGSQNNMYYYETSFSSQTSREENDETCVVDFLGKTLNSGAYEKYDVDFTITKVHVTSGVNHYTIRLFSLCQISGLVIITPIRSRQN